MFKSISKVYFSLTSVAAASMLLFASTAIAGPGTNDKGKPGPLDIVASASAVNAVMPIFNTVLAAAQCEYFDGAVVGILSGNKKVTLFAPVDSAFAELGLDEGNVCSTFEDDPDTLLAILAYHVTQGRRFSNSVFDLEGDPKEIRMILGSGYITTEGGKIYGSGNDLDDVLENDNPISIVGDFFDIKASNGVIHVIDTVLIP